MWIGSMSLIEGEEVEVGFGDGEGSAWVCAVRMWESRRDMLLVMVGRDGEEALMEAAKSCWKSMIRRAVFKPRVGRWGFGGRTSGVVGMGEGRGARERVVGWLYRFAR